MVATSAAQLQSCTFISSKLLVVVLRLLLLEKTVSLLLLGWISSTLLVVQHGESEALVEFINILYSYSVFSFLDMFNSWIILCNK